jgi:hypothetical protein
VHACDKLCVCADQVKDLVALFASFPSAILSQGASERASARAACESTSIYACERPVFGKKLAPRDCDVFVRGQSICAEARRQHDCQSLCVRQAIDSTWQWMDAIVSSHTSHCGCRIPGRGRAGERGETRAGIISEPLRDPGDAHGTPLADRASRTCDPIVSMARPQGSRDGL